MTNDNLIGFKRGAFGGQMETNRVMPHEVEIGMHIFRVVAPGGRKPVIEELLVKTRPEMRASNGTRAFKACTVNNGKVTRFESFCALQDLGIIINDYNMSLTFHDRENAEAYCTRLISEDLTVFEFKRWAKVLKRNLNIYLNGEQR
jgi:hypothetical protein